MKKGNIGLALRYGDWSSIERENFAAAQDGIRITRRRLGIFWQESDISKATKNARQMQRPTECPKCHCKFPLESVGKSIGVSKIFLGGRQKNGKPRYRCSVCNHHFDGRWTLEFPPPLRRPVKHGRSRYNKHGCRCAICVATIRAIWRKKERIRRNRNFGLLGLPSEAQC